MPQPIDLRIGILGGGQLARMLALRGHSLGFRMSVLCPNADEPAVQVTKDVTRGNPRELNDVLAFAKTVDVLTIESEFFDAGLLAKVEEAGARLWPSAAHLASLQDRLPQKRLLVEHGIPTAEFLPVASPEALQMAARKFGKFVLKKRTGGYDGYGTTVFKSAKDIETKEMDFSRTTYIAEAWIPFKRELAVQFARSVNGDLIRFPLVETHQVDNRLDWLKGPVKHAKFAPFAKTIERMLQKTGYVGTIAFELFDAPQGLLVNEIAPRVHNSGHYSMEALTLDQFSAHLLAVAGHGLHQPNLLTKGFAMVNLIGTGRETAEIKASPRGHLHWYGKTESRKGRKMGHITAAGTKAEILLKELLRQRKGLLL